MSDAQVGALALAAFALLFLLVLLGWRRRSPEDVITAGTGHGATGLAVHPWRDQRPGLVAVWLVALGVLACGLMWLRAQPYAGVLFTAFGLVLTFVAWGRTSGRFGDGTITLTPEGLHQRAGGSDVLIPWDDVRGLVSTPQQLIVETDLAVRPVRVLPRLFGPKRVLTEDAIGLPSSNLPPMPWPEMLHLYGEDPAARAELSTPEVVDRGRATMAEIVADVDRAFPLWRRALLGLLGPLRLAGWMAFAWGVAGLYLFAKPGRSTPPFSTWPAPLGIAVAGLAAAVLAFVAPRWLRPTLPVEDMETEDLGSDEPGITPGGRSPRGGG